MTETAGRATSAARERLAADLARRYAEGASIRDLATSTGRSYSFVRRVLQEHGVFLRGRSGSQRRTARLGLRASQEQVDLVWEAAMLEGKTLSAFVVEAAASHARDVVAKHRDLVLSEEAFERFYAELDTPAESVPELVELFRRPRQLPKAAANRP